MALLCCSGISAFGQHPGVTNLKTLIVHADAGGLAPDPTAVSDMEGMVFDDTDNIKDALFDATYGHFQLAAGPVLGPDGNPIKSIKNTGTSMATKLGLLSLSTRLPLLSLIDGRPSAVISEMLGE